MTVVAPRAGSCDVRRADWLDGVCSLAPGSVDLVYVDPPFNTGETQRDRAGEFEDRWSGMSEYIGWLRERLSATLPALRRSANVLLHVDWRTSHHVRLLLDELVGPDRFINHLVWSYGLGGSTPRRFARKHDDILFYCVDPERYWFEAPMVPATSQRMKGMMKKATDVLNIPSINNMSFERVGWPTQKPLALLELLVRACCPPGGTVLDPCCGSGTTLAAALRTGRRGVGFDVSTEAIGVARRRLATIRDGRGRSRNPSSPTPL
ncbi:MAG: site-specific DNA-methyltransferase [Phycisphaerae bacterium]|nr:site-specific DNA-methyltransferase [Phycisphaerae bacterium]